MLFYKSLPVIFSLFFLPTSAQHNAEKQAITQKFTYTSEKVSELYLVWGTNFWKCPKREFLPAGTYVKDSLAYTKMSHTGNAFYTSLTLPYSTELNYFFWSPKDNMGKEVNAWDNNGQGSYLNKFDTNKSVSINDSKISIYRPAFSILRVGKFFLFFSLFLLLLIFLLKKEDRTPGKISFVAGSLVTAFIYIFLARAEIAQLSHKTIPVILGSAFSDMLWLFAITILFFPLIHFFRNKKTSSNVSFTIFSLVILLTVLASILNIEVVKQLGTPLSIKWLYYSDFGKGNDARAGILKTLTPVFIKNILMLVASFIIISLSLSVSAKNLLKHRKFVIPVFSVLFIFYLVCFYEYKNNHFTTAKVEAPAIAFISSVFDPGGQEQLLKSKIAMETEKYLNDYHNNFYASAPESNVIDNVILFVSESTPKQFIGIYDSVFNCTPNIKKWSSISRAYTNMYAHIPSTPNSMFTLLSGVYPMVDYKLASSEKLQITSSLPKVLNSNGWATSLFFSSDLSYAGMDKFARNENISTIQDYNTLPCSQKYTTTQSNIDGVNDECLVNSYFNWVDSSSIKKKFSILWTNQTHFPYYIDKERVYTKENANLNRYLNALHHTDVAFNQLMSELQKRNKLKSTLVIFIADHGEAFNTHEQTLHASRIYEENVHIPCFLYNPVLFKGTSDSQIHGLVDIDVTISHLLGMQKPKEWQGRSLLDDKAGGRTFFGSPYTDLLIGTRDKDWKYIYNVDTREPELYSLSNDPKELNNVSDQYPEITRKEHEMLVGWMKYEHNKYNEMTGAKTVSR